MKDKLQKLIERAYEAEDKYGNGYVDIFEAYSNLSGILVDICRLLQEQIEENKK